jgi:hypothetical protein
MEYADEMALGGMMYIPVSMKIGVEVQNLLGGGIHTHRQQADIISLLLFIYFSKNKESGVKTSVF